MVSGSAKVNLNKTCFDAAPPLRGFYYPSLLKCLCKSQKKIAIRPEDQYHKVLYTDSGGSEITESDNSKSFTFNESWQSIEHDDKYDEPLNREEHAHEKFCHRGFWLHSVAKNETLQYQDKPTVNSGTEDENYAWNSISLDGNQKQIFDSERSTHGEALQLQKRASKVLKSAKTLFCSGNATKDNCPTNKGFVEEEGLKQNSSLDNSCLLNSGDRVSHWNQGHWLKEKNPSVDTVMISEAQVVRNADDTSVDSSDFLVSTEGLGRWSGTNASSEESIQPNFVYLEGTNENKLLNHCTSDLPFSQYWKANLNKDILYQWRIKRRIQLAREQAKSEKQDFVPTRIFTQNQVTSEMRNSSKITLTESENQLPQDVKLHVPWYSQAKTSTKTPVVPNIQSSQYTKSGISSQSRIFSDMCIPPCLQAATSSKLTIIPDCQFSLPGRSALNIQFPSNIDYQEPPPLLPNNPLETEVDQSDQLRTIETVKRSQSKKSFLLQKEQVNAEVQTSPLENFLTSCSHSSSRVSPCYGQSDSHNSQDSDSPQCKYLSSNSENYTTQFTSASLSDQLSSGKTTKYHKYLVAEKPHCSNFGHNFPFSNQKKDKISKIQKKNLLKPDKFHGQKFRTKGRMENKSLHTVFKNLYDDSCKSQETTYNQIHLSGEFNETPNGLVNDSPLFSDYQSSSDEEFSSDLMLWHFRKQRSKFKEQLRFIDEKLKILFTSEKD